MSMTGILLAQHRHCDEMLAAMEDALRAGHWEHAHDHLAAFGSATLAHFQLEEASLFPAFEAATGMVNGPTRVMCSEHDQARQLLHALQQAVQQRDTEEAIALSETLLILLQQHNLKEESVLYPMCERHVPELDEVLG